MQRGKLIAVAVFVTAWVALAAMLTACGTVSALRPGGGLISRHSGPTTGCFTFYAPGQPPEVTCMRNP